MVRLQGNRSTGRRSTWHALVLADLERELKTNLVHGLASDEVTARRAQWGWNELTESPPVPMWRRLLAQFRELVIWILIVAAIISGFLGEWADTAAILAIVFVNGVIGFLQEERAGRALAALRKLASPSAKVVRQGLTQLVPARDIVPGDRMELEAGDYVTADARIVTAHAFRVQEAALTGESVPVEKEPHGTLPPDTPLGDRRNMVYAGTVVATGRAVAVVVGTGMQTELGSIAGLLEQVEPEPTPLQKRLAELGKVLVWVCLAIVLVIFAMELSRGRPLLEVLLVSVSLAVAAVPEGLPAVVTLALAIGLQRMVARNALVRKLPSVETLGSVTVICSDKTGTLTRNEMTVRQIATHGRLYHVSGSGYAPQGEFTYAAEEGVGEGNEPRELSAPAQTQPHNTPQPVDLTREPDLIQALRIASRCNTASVRPAADGYNNWTVIGDPTEGALLVAAMKGNVAEWEATEGVVLEIPFDSDRKTMSVVTRDEQRGLTTMYSKGAPEMLLDKCQAELCQGEVVPLTDARRQEIAESNALLAAQALRVLALAYRPCEEPAADCPAENELIFVGLVGMLDPPREEVKSAIARCRSAGIRAVMITGDHPATALAIARELRLAQPTDQILSGADLDQLTDPELVDRVSQVAVYARVSAEHKLRVVRAWRQRGEIVAMTGDGVNDAPAVNAADIGIAMGVTGTDVTKEASDMVLIDDNFASIVNAVEEGRGIFDNIQKFVHFLLSCNAGEVLLMFGASLLGWPVPLMAIQLLWINLVTDGLPALALGMEPPERDLMVRPPRPPHEPVITWQHGLQMLRDGTLIALVAGWGFWLVYQGSPENLQRARTVAFCVTAYAQLFFVFACRSHHRTMPQLGLFSNPHLLAAVLVSGLLQLSVVMLPFAQPVFETGHHLSWEWVWIAGLSLLPVTIIEVGKILVWLFYRPDATCAVGLD